MHSNRLNRLETWYFLNEQARNLNSFFDWSSLVVFSKCVVIAPQTLASSAWKTLYWTLVPFWHFVNQTSGLVLLSLLSYVLFFRVDVGYDTKSERNHHKVLSGQVFLNPSPIFDHVPKYFNRPRHYVVRDLNASLWLLPGYTKSGERTQQQVANRVVENSSRPTKIS